MRKIKTIKGIALELCRREAGKTASDVIIKKAQKHIRKLTNDT